jgi:hypothetical protein
MISLSPISEYIYLRTRAIIVAGVNAFSAIEFNISSLKSRSFNTLNISFICKVN